MQRDGSESWNWIFYCLLESLSICAGQLPQHNSQSITQEVALCHLGLNGAEGGSQGGLCRGQQICYERKKEQVFSEEQNQQCDAREQRGRSVAGWLQRVSRDLVPAVSLAAVCAAVLILQKEDWYLPGSLQSEEGGAIKAADSISV